jgi:DNA-binding MarR family transcriptional regulator
MKMESFSSRIHVLDVQLQVAIDAALLDAGITAAQWRVLDAASTVPGSSSADLARACRVTPQTMQQLVVQLEAAGLLVRTPHPVHGRVQQIYVSNAGELRHAAGSIAIAAVEDRIFTAFSADDRAAFSRLVSLALGVFRRS